MHVASDARSQAGEASNRAEHAAGELRRRILSLALRPGESLPERRLERLLGVSRSPIRQALADLARQGLVRREGRSYRVAPLDLAELRRLFAFRSLLETAAVRWAAEAPEEDRLASVDAVLTALHTTMAPDARLAMTARLHLALARASGNRFLADSLEALLPQVTRARYLEMTTPDAVTLGDAEHSRIVELVRERRGEAAADLMRSHLARTLEHLERSLEGLGPGVRHLAGGELA